LKRRPQTRILSLQPIQFKLPCVFGLHWRSFLRRFTLDRRRSIPVGP
jgi:hypothetical protein